jgi:hypothetical protein
MPRKPSAVLQYKLRIREDLRQQIEKAAKKDGVSANFEMVRRLKDSFGRESLLSIANVAQDMTILWARYGEALHELEKQGDLMRATTMLIKQIEQLPEVETDNAIKVAIEKTKAVIRVIEIEASVFPRRMHTTGAKL